MQPVEGKRIAALIGDGFEESELTETRRALEQCSCSIDVIATLLPYERYVTAETVLSMAQVPGTLGNQFRSTEYAKAAVEQLRRAQAEAEVRCF